jgi:hypothetical protein
MSAGLPAASLDGASATQPIGLRMTLTPLHLGICQAISLGWDDTPAWRDKCCAVVARRHDVTFEDVAAALKDAVSWGYLPEVAL